MSEQNNAALEAYNASLQTGWDDIEDVPDYVTLPEGTFRGIITDAKVEVIEGKDGKEDTAVSKFVVQVTQNIDNPEVTEGIVGCLASYGYVGDFGKKMIKKSMWEIITGLGVANIADLWEQLPGKEVVFTTKTTYSKPDLEGHKKTYSNIQLIMLAE